MRSFVFANKGEISIMYVLTAVIASVNKQQLCPLKEREKDFICCYMSSYLNDRIHRSPTIPKVINLTINVHTGHYKLIVPTTYASVF